MQQSITAAGLFILSLTPHTSLPAAIVPGSTGLQVYEHVVKSHESLTDIAATEYGSVDYWTTLWNDNPTLINPDTLTPGTKLLVRLQKPLLVEPVTEGLLARALASPSPHLDSRLAFTKATDHPIGGAGTDTPSVMPISPPSNFDDAYKAAGDRYGVPWQVLYGIHLTETGLRDGPISNATGSGAEGPMQFMRGTWSEYAVDGNGDGVADIDNAVDAIHTAANYIARHGGVTQALQSYGGNISGTLAAACERGYCQ